MPSPIILLSLLGAGGLLVASFAKGSKGGADASTPTPGSAALTSLVEAPTTKKTVDMPLDLKQQVANALKAMGYNEYGQVTGKVTEAAIQNATALASMLGQMGYKEAETQLREYAKMASKMLPPPTEPAAPLPGIPPELQTKLDSALRLERDPAKLRALAAALKLMPGYSTNAQMKNMAQMLEQAAAQVEAAQQQNQVLSQVNKVLTASTPKDFTAPQFTPPAPAPAPVVAPAPAPAPVPAPALPAPVAKTPVEKAAETLALHLNSLQRNAGGNVKAVKGKEDVSLVKRFQALTNTTTDGKAGPGTTALMAEHGVCELPLVMYWPKSATASHVYKYREAVRAIAERRPDECANSLKMSASRERGQAGIVGTMPA